MAQQRCDDIISALVAQHDSLPALLTTLFDWLHRRSDLYIVDPSPTRPIGFASGEAERLLLRAFRAFPYKAPPSSEPAGSAPAPRPEAGGALAALPPPPPQPPQPQQRPPLALAQPPSPSLVRYTGEGKQVPVASGGVGPGYWWEQSLTTATLYVLMPAGTPSRAVECALGAGGRHLRLALRGAAAPIVDAPLPHAVQAGEEGLVWNLETPDAPPQLRVDPVHGCHAPPQGCGLCADAGAQAGRLFSLFLEKTVHTWWRSFTQGGPEIDAQRVDSTQPMSAYDEDTQAAIRKAMAEQAMKLAAGSGGGGGGSAGPPHSSL